MKKFLFTSVLVLCSGLARAQGQSTTQMSLTKSQQFLDRIQYLLEQQARTVILEAQTDASHSGADTGANAADLNYTATCHTSRLQFAVIVVGSPNIASSVAALIVSANFADAVLIVGGGVSLTGSGATLDLNVTDTPILQAIRHNWNIFSRNLGGGQGCFTNP